jgi:molybdenum cofactor sulfurtransferase
MTLAADPIKSCAGMHLAPGQHWPVTAQGLLFDREWMIVDSANRRALTQKRHPKMACIRASVDLSAASLSIFVPHHGSFLLDTGQAPTLPTSGKVCADTVQSHRHSLNELDEALSSWLGVACTLHRISPLSASSRHSHFAGSSRTPIRLSNESPFLLINAASVSRVDKWCMSEGEDSKIGTDAFRANFVIKSVGGSDAATAFIEDAWQSLVCHRFMFSDATDLQRSASAARRSKS